MNERGEIREFGSVEEARAAGFNITLSEEQAMELLKAEPDQRRQLLIEMRERGAESNTEVRFANGGVLEITANEDLVGTLTKDTAKEMQLVVNDMPDFRRPWMSATEAAGVFRRFIEEVTGGLKREARLAFLETKPRGYGWGTPDWRSLRAKPRQERIRKNARRRRSSGRV